MIRPNQSSTFCTSLGAALLFALALFNPALAQQQEGTANQSADETQSMAQNLLDSIHRFRLSNFRALNKYYSYTTDPEEQLASEINETVQTSAKLLNQIEEQAGDSLTGDEVQELVEAYNKFDDQMQTNIEDIRGKGYPDLRLLKDMANQAQTLNKLSGEIYDKAASQDRISTNAQVELAREASVTMALMVTRYSARSSSSMSQIFQGADVDQTLDELAKEFEGHLQELRDKAGDNQQVDSLLSEVSSKWEFIRDSYINYDQENVSFVINRYSTTIVESLEKSINQLKAA